MRTPSPSHPWIDFTLDLERLRASTWMLMGEAMSKCEHLIGSPLKPAVAAMLSETYLARGVHATTAIEGNTLSEAEVKARLNGEGELPPSREYLGQEVDNIAQALGEIGACVSVGVLMPLTTDRIKDLHGKVLKGLDNPPDDDPGNLRRHNVGVARYRAPDWQQVEGLLDSLCEWLRELEAPPNAPREQRFYSAVLRAILAHLYIAWIHPFGNGNGRTARLLEVQILSQSGTVPLVATSLLSDHYNKTRDRYYQALDAASKARDVEGFIFYAMQGFVDELREQIKVVKGHNLRIAWESYVHEQFGRFKPTTAKNRQRRVVLAMPMGDFVTVDYVRYELPARVTGDYAKAGDRMAARDLNALTRMGLLEKRDGTYRTRLEIIEAFASPVAKPEPIPLPI